MTLVNTALSHVLQPSKPTAPISGAVKEYYRDAGDGFVKKYAQSSSGEEVRISGVEVEYMSTTPSVLPTNEEGDTVIVTSDGTKDGVVLQEYKFSTVGGSMWKKTFDSADNVWSKNTTNASIDLNKKSNNTARTAGTEVVVSDSGNLGVGITNPSAKLHVKGTSPSIKIESYTSSSSAVLTFANNGVNSGYVGMGSTNDNMHLMNYLNQPLHLGTNSAIHHTISPEGYFGVKNQSPETQLDIIGSMKFSGPSSVPTYYNVGTYTASGGVTGAIKIVFPKSGSDTMFHIKLDIYNYQNTTGASQVILGGYNYTGGMNVNNTYTINGAFPSNLVRYGRSATESYILLGDFTTTWSYPKVVVSQAQMSHSSYNGYGSQWATSIVTNVGTDTLHTPTLIKSSASSSDLMSCTDNRAISPADTPIRSVEAHFTSWNNNNTVPYADALNFRSYADATGGNDNLVSFRKDAIGMRIWQNTFGATSNYSNFKDVQLAPKTPYYTMAANYTATLENRNIQRTLGNLTLPAPAVALAGFEYFIRNRASTAMTISAYIDKNGVSATSVPANTVLHIVSSGTQWLEF